MAARPSEDRRLTAPELGALLALVAVPVLIFVIFVVLRDSPPNWDCGDNEPVGQDARLDAFRSGAIALHVGCAAVLGAAIAALSAERVHKRGRPRAVGRPTLLALALVAAYIVASLIVHDLFVFAGFAGFLVIGVGVEATSGGLTVLAALVVAGLLVWGARRSRARGYLLATVAWFELTIGLAGSLAVIYLDGNGPILC